MPELVNVPELPKLPPKLVELWAMLSAPVFLIVPELLKLAPELIVMLRVPVLLIVAELDMVAGRPTGKSDSTVIVPLLLSVPLFEKLLGAKSVKDAFNVPLLLKVPELEKLLGSPIVVTLIVPLLLNVPALARLDASAVIVPEFINKPPPAFSRPVNSISEISELLLKIPEVQPIRVAIVWPVLNGLWKSQVSATKGLILGKSLSSVDTMQLISQLQNAYDELVTG